MEEFFNSYKIKIKYVMLDLKDKGTESKNKNKPIYVASQLPQS